ncbi:MAG: hypothetical protein E3J64_05945 [Anaerolineales bacterium]|nr:MAG: hypothetical protein E3J64_05945 [Anaerolineales bacterium]
MAAANASSATADVHGLVMDLAAGIVKKYLPKSGELRKWTISEIERSLLDDMGQFARSIVEARLEADPQRVVEKPRCPDCGRALGGVGSEVQTHRHTLFGTIRYRRTYGVCRPCRAAFSPSGQRVVFRQGLL